MLDSGSNMEIIQLVIGIVLIVSVKFLIFKIIYNRIRISKLSKEELKFDKIRPISRKLKKQKTPKKKLIFKYANNLEKRVLVFEILKKHDKLKLFPNELSTREKASESYFVNWLDMNDEYDSLPDEINYFETKILENDMVLIIFKFKSYEPHIFASKGWLYGYVGYNIFDAELYAKPKFIMSDFNDIILTTKNLKAQLNI